MTGETHQNVATAAGRLRIPSHYWSRITMIVRDSAPPCNKVHV
ncbi:hypothetical protein GJA_4775 [Janthinobacterium agaricidamnosum NBRC 102515 = DSM 9628]|uniref:Uncharacterized protein n=1 Tax=Janthinobacterium agaricidamnosum NBRC 102515 = DSM 9628 TaxID=1349767 RepID=W0V975_9BURK|nr:hypothetical protein GJA_4775 [Janthinobacterium agaricidamnosum NBRC 102515 = DSM 9628]